MNENVSAIVCDIDGVLANNSHRQHYINAQPKDWNQFYLACDEDSKINIGINLLEGLILANYENHYTEVIFLTGRSEICRQQTHDWIQKNVFLGNMQTHLIMRQPDDFRKAHEFKKEVVEAIYDSYNIVLAIDDDPTVVEEFNKLGISTILFRQGN